METHEDFLNRLKEAIKDGDAKQVRIAEYCDVSEQAVARWKRTGQISKDNLFSLSEISGYRYLWIKDGQGAKRISSVTENRNEYMKAENAKVYYARDTEDSDDIEQLVEAIRKAHANKVLSDQAISHLTSFINALNNRR
jgi:transcriptional regulator with XRE-family HTH domain